MHLDKKSAIARNKIIQLKSHSIDYMQRSVNDDDLFFTSVFSSDPETRLKIKGILLEALTQISTLVIPSNSEEVYILDIGLFSH